MTSTTEIRDQAQRDDTAETICRERNGGTRACDRCARRGRIARIVLGLLSR